MGGFRPLRPDGSIADLLLQRGDIMAGQAARSGQIWGNVANQLGQIGAGAVQNYAAEKERKTQEQALTGFLSNLPEDPEEVLRTSVQILGPEGADFAKGVLDYRLSAQKAQQGEVPTFDEFESSAQALAKLYKKAPEFVMENWGSISQTLGVGAKEYLGTPLGQEWRPEYGQALDTFAADPKLITMSYRNAQGQDVQEVVPQEAGVMRVSEPEEKELPELGTKERYIYDRYGPEASVEQQVKALKEFDSLSRAPERPPTRRYQRANVMSNGKARLALFDSATGKYFDPNTKDELTDIEPLPSTTVQNRQAAARSSITSGEDIFKRLDDKKFLDEIGPVMGRYNSLLAAAGEGNPRAQYLVGALKSFSALQPQIHGFRAFEMARDIEDLITTKQSPESLKAGLKGILSASYIVADKPVPDFFAEEQPTEEETVGVGDLTDDEMDALLAGDW